jgi:hypothetical protein
LKCLQLEIHRSYSIEFASGSFTTQFIMIKFITPLVALGALLFAGCSTSHHCCPCPRQFSHGNAPRGPQQPFHQPGVQQQPRINGQQNFPGPHRWSSREMPAPDSVEGQLRAKGKRWERTNEPIKKGAYVQDILEGRLDQPVGRGALGKVVEVKEENGHKAAIVEFQRGYKVPIQFSELTAVRIIDPKNE